MRDTTRPNQAIKIKHLSTLALIALLIVAVAMTILFLVFAWYLGVLHLPELPFFRSSSTSPTSLNITVIPTDATITINGKAYSPMTAQVPGNYEVMVTRDGYYSTKELVRVHPNTANLVSIRLIPIASTASIADDAAAPGWDGQGNLYFISLADSKVYRWTNGSQAPVADVQGELYQLLVSTAGDRAYVLVVQGSDSPSELYAVDLHNGSSTDLHLTGFATLGPDGKAIWGTNSDPKAGGGKPVWSLEPGGEPRWTSLESPVWATAGIQAQIDPSGHWLAVVSSKGIAVWEISGGKLLVTIAGASTPLWIGGAHPGLAYRGTDGSLEFAEADLEWVPILISSDVPAPIAVMTGGTEIVFTRFDPFAGGTSFWAIDISTKGVRLLSEAKIESGRVKQFAISLDGKKIAFVNEQNVLYLVVLEP